MGTIMSAVVSCSKGCIGVPRPGSAGFEMDVDFVVARSSRWFLGQSKKVAGTLSQKAVKG